MNVVKLKGRRFYFRPNVFRLLYSSLSISTKMIFKIFVTTENKIATVDNVQLPTLQNSALYGTVTLKHYFMSIKNEAYLAELHMYGLIQVHIREFIILLSFGSLYRRSESCFCALDCDYLL